MCRPWSNPRRICGLVSEVRPGAFFAQPAKTPSKTFPSLAEARGYVEEAAQTKRARRPRADAGDDLFGGEEQP